MPSFNTMSETEQEIMSFIWDAGRTVSRREISRHFQEEKQWNKNTVITFLARLVQKGLLDAQRAGRENVYTPTVGRQEYLKGEGQRFLDKHFSGSMGAFVLAMFDGEPIGASEAQALQAMIDRAREKQ